MIFEYITENTTLSFQSARDSGRSSPGTKSSGEEKNRENLGCPDFSRGVPIFPDFSLDRIASSLYIINENDFH